MFVLFFPNAIQSQGDNRPFLNQPPPLEVPLHEIIENPWLTKNGMTHFMFKSSAAASSGSDLLKKVSCEICEN